MLCKIPNLGPKANAIIQAVPEQFQGVMVAISGGPDSTALLHALWQITKTNKNFHIAAFHVNFGLRGAESDGDEAYCGELAAGLDVPLKIRRVSADERAARQGESTQAWARRLRYAEFSALAAERWVIALAHHQGDLAENVLLRMARGAGPGHLLGMSEWTPPIWRPWLGTTKAAILAYLAENGLSYRVDASNASDAYSRNAVRHKVLPELERLFPGAAARLVACAEEARDLANYSAEKLTIDTAGGTADAVLSTGVARSKAAALVQKHLMTTNPATPHGQAADASARLTQAAPVQLSRRLLDQVALGSTKVPSNLTLPGAVQVRVGPDHLVPAPSPLAQKAPREAQHTHTLMGPSIGALLEPGSYALIRCNGGISKLEAVEGAATGDSTLSTKELRLRPAPAQETLRFRGIKRGYSRKYLLRLWDIPAPDRGSYLVVLEDGATLGLSNGQKIYVPGPGGRQTECSQDSTNLRYFRDV